MDRGQEHDAEGRAELDRFLDDFVRSMETWPDAGPSHRPEAEDARGSRRPRA